jgi:hypothetical protein
MIIIAFSSCQRPHNGIDSFDPRVIKEQEILLSEISDEIKYIPLDNRIPLGSLYGNLFFTSDAIYLSAQNQGILKYDRTGRFVTKIGKIGRGPGEYVHFSEFRLDIEENIYVRDNNYFKVYSKTGKYLRSFSIGEYIGGIDLFEIYNSNIFIFYLLQRAETRNDWVILDNFGSLLKVKNRSIPDFICEWGEPWVTYIFKKRMYYWNPFSDTIYSINSDFKVNPHLLISPGEHRMPRSRIYSFENYNKYLHIKRILETDRYLIIIYSFIKPYLLLIDKKNDNRYMTYLQGDPSGDGLSLEGGINNDFFGSIPFLPRTSFDENGREYLVGLINPYQIVSDIKIHQNNDFLQEAVDGNESFIKIASNINETDNQILMIVRLRK